MDELNYSDFKSYIEENLREREILYLLEDFNLKDVLWGSLPGMFLSNLTPPLVGFNSVENLLLHKNISTATEKNHFQKIIEEIENVSD